MQCVSFGTLLLASPAQRVVLKRAAELDSQRRAPQQQNEAGFGRQPRTCTPEGEAREGACTPALCAGGALVCACCSRVGGSCTRRSSSWTLQGRQQAGARAALSAPNCALLPSQQQGSVGQQRLPARRPLHMRRNNHCTRGADIPKNTPEMPQREEAQRSTAHRSSSSWMRVSLSWCAACESTSSACAAACTAQHAPWSWPCSRSLPAL